MVDSILHLHGALAYAIIFALPALESSALVGVVFPGEIAVLPGGVLAFQGQIGLGGTLWAGGVTLLGYAAGSGYRRAEHLVGRASEIVLGLIAGVILIAALAHWVSRNPDRMRAWAKRQRARPSVRRFARQLDFLGRRFQPRKAFGLGLMLGLALVGLIGVGFGAVLQDVARREELVHLDRPILDLLMRHSDQTVTAFMKGVTMLGSGAFITGAAGIVALVLALRHAWPRAGLIVSVPLGAWVLERGVKILVARPRPPVHALVHATGFSFPSGHATMAAAFYGGLALLLARATRSWRGKVGWWTAAVVIVGLVGFSRMYLRVHYLTDVLGGISLGALWLAVVANGFATWTRARR